MYMPTKKRKTTSKKKKTTIKKTTIKKKTTSKKTTKKRSKSSSSPQVVEFFYDVRSASPSPPPTPVVPRRQSDSQFIFNSWQITEIVCAIEKDTLNVKIIDMTASQFEDDWSPNETTIRMHFHSMYDQEDSYSDRLSFCEDEYCLSDTGVFYLLNKTTDKHLAVDGYPTVFAVSKYVNLEKEIHYYDSFVPNKATNNYYDPQGNYDSDGSYYSTEVDSVGYNMNQYYDYFKDNHITFKTTKHILSSPALFDGQVRQHVKKLLGSYNLTVVPTSGKWSTGKKRSRSERKQQSSYAYPFANVSWP
jgi:hypothetical protein